MTQHVKPHLRPHHDGSTRFVPNQAPALGDQATVFVAVPSAAGVTEVDVRSTPDGEPRFVAAVPDRVVGDETWWRAEVEVRNPVTNYRFLLSGPAHSSWLTGAGVVDHDVPDSTDFRLVAWPPPPAWAADAVVYQIFPDRFANSGAARELPTWAVPCAWDDPVIGDGPQTPYQFYGGDLDGITAHLDHIVDLGANTVYLTPIFPASSNHRYDAAAFDRVDPLLGGDAALSRLAEAVHRRGLRLLGDLTPNHCGQTHPWFTTALADPTAPERAMFYVEDDNSYESWCGVPSLPKLNWASPELRRRFREIAQQWLVAPYGLDGWRIDVANMTGRRGADAHTHQVAALLREAVRDVRPDALMMAEHAHDPTADLDRGGWDAVMNYAGFLRPVWNWLRSDSYQAKHFLGVPGNIPHRGGAQVAATMRAFAAGRSWRSLTHSWTLLGSHDTARVATVLGPDAVELGLGLLMTYPGTPMVFAGDELGLLGDNGEDARRTMPWSAPWDRAVLDRYRKFIRVRQSSHALRHGGLRWVWADEDTLVYLRESERERLLVCVRRSAGGPLVLGDLGATSIDVVYGASTASVAADGSVVVAAGGPSCQIFALSS